MGRGAKRKEPETEDLRSPDEIMQEIERLDAEGRKIMQELKAMLNTNQNDMSFFKQLFSISPDADITMRIMGKNGKYTVSVTPAVRESKIAPIILSGTAEDLDQDFMNMIKAPLNEAGAVIKNLTNFQESLKEAEKDGTAAKPDPKKTTPAAAKPEASHPGPNISKKDKKAAPKNAAKKPQAAKAEKEDIVAKTVAAANAVELDERAAEVESSKAPGTDDVAQPAVPETAAPVERDIFAQ